MQPLPDLSQHPHATGVLCDELRRHRTPEQRRALAAEARVVSVLPSLPTDADLSLARDPGARIIVSCERAKEWLAAALAGDDMERISEIKSQAEAIRVYTIQRQLGKDAELSAAEIVRRAERCIGLAIRKGQAEGRINTRGDQRSDQHREKTLVSPSVYLAPGDATVNAYAMADNVSDEAFEAAIGEAKAEGNLSRANVVRKVRGEPKLEDGPRLAALIAEGNTSHQIAALLGISRSAVMIRAKKAGLDIHADRVVGKTRRIDPERVLRSFAETLESLAPSCEQIEPEKIDRAVVAECLGLIDDACRAIGRLRSRLRRAIG